MFDDTWTAGRLIEELSKHDPDTKVLSEGCDCWGTVRGVEMRDGQLLITRLAEDEPVDIGLPEIQFG